MSKQCRQRIEELFSTAFGRLPTAEPEALVGLLEARGGEPGRHGEKATVQRPQEPPRDFLGGSAFEVLAQSIGEESGQVWLDREVGGYELRSTSAPGGRPTSTSRPTLGWDGRWRSR